MAANLLQKLVGKIPLDLLRRLLNLWPPFLGAGIHVLNITSDFRYIKVQLNYTWWNKNYVGTQFGGSLYMMTDPFYMLMLINNLGSDYVVWDKGASIDFKKPGVSLVTAEFHLTDDVLQTVRERTANNEKYIFDLPVDIVTSTGDIIASVIKTLYVRRKRQ